MKMYRLFYKIFQSAADKKIQECKPFIKKGSRILDVGCGSGVTAKLLHDFFGAEVVGADVKDNRIHQVPFKLIDGRNLPFPDNYFDAVLISFVLHHAKDPVALLKESKRVSAELVIVYEDIPENFFSKFICLIHIFLSSKMKFYPSISNLSSFKKEAEWERIFDSLGFLVISKKNIRSFPLKKIQFVLKSD